MSTDDLNALLQSRRWIRRRVDRVEFLDLMTVRRTIVLTLDLEALANLLPWCTWSVIPLGWFVPWANAAAVLLDAGEHVVPCLTSQESDLLIQPQIEDRLETLKIVDEDLVALVDTIRLHRNDAGIQGYGCTSCAKSAGAPGDAELMCDKWGCRATLPLLTKLCSVDSEEAQELARILLAWQTNFVLYAHVDACGAADGWATLKLSFDEELREWEPPWERRQRILEYVDPVASRRPWHRKCVRKQTALSPAQSRECRGHISREGPFNKDLDDLFPRYLNRALAGRKCLWLRKVGRRGMLGLVWHVAWLQASGMGANSHQVDVILPSELMAVRMRILRARKEKRYANVADQVGARATIVAPDVDRDERDHHRAPPPTLLSLVITQRSPTSWFGGAWLSFLTSVAILAIALWWLPPPKEDSTDLITILIVAPTLVATLLSVRAGSDIAEQLTKALRRLIGAVGVLAAVCAVSLIAEHAALAAPDLKRLWIAIAVLLLFITVVLLAGALRMQRLIAVGRAFRPREIRDPLPGTVLSPKDVPRIPPPDCWLAAGEGELVPWGWLDEPPFQPGSPAPSSADKCFWRDHPKSNLIEWVRDDVTGFGDASLRLLWSSQQQRREPKSNRRIETARQLNNLLHACETVVADMPTSAPCKGDVDVQRLRSDLLAVESGRLALQPSGLRAAVSLLWRLASEVLRECEASHAQVDAITSAHEHAAKLATGYERKLWGGDDRPLSPTPICEASTRPG